MFRITRLKNGEMLLEAHGMMIESVSDHTGTTVFMPVTSESLSELEGLIWSEMMELRMGNAKRN